MKRLAVLVILLIGGGWWLLRPDLFLSSDLESSIDRLVADAMAEGPIAGLSIGIARGGRVVLAKGYGFADLENEIPASDETVYRIGSITKQFTAAAVIQLAEEGQLTLEDPVTEYVPEFPTFGQDVTLHSILSHTSGIPNVTTMPNWWETMALERTPDELVAGFAGTELDFEPGTRFSYSNSGYLLMGLLIERVSDQPFGGYLNEHLATPLGLRSTTYCARETLIPNRARGYRVRDGEFENATYMSMSQAFSAGAVCSSATDLLLWTRGLSRGDVISDNGFARMSTPRPLADGTEIEYGYGMAAAYLDGHRRLSHIGGMLGFAGQIAHYVEDDVTVVVLSNTEDASVAALENEISRLVLGLDERAILDLPMTEEELAVYVGEYDVELTRLTVSARDGRLEVDAPLPGGRNHHVLLFQGNHTFVAEVDHEIVVHFDVTDGTAVSFDLSLQGIPIEGRRVATDDGSR